MLATTFAGILATVNRRKLIIPFISVRHISRHENHAIYTAKIKRNMRKNENYTAIIFRDFGKITNFTTNLRHCHDIQVS